MHTKILFLLYILILISSTLTSRINSVKSQRIAKERSRKNKGKIISKYKKYPAPIQPLTKPKKRSLQDDDQGSDGDGGDDSGGDDIIDDNSEDIAYTYDRCDNGHTPDDISDCTGASTANSTCCMFTYGVDTGCVLIGFQYLGSKTIGDMTVTCVQKFLNISYLKILVAFLGLLVL